MEWVMFMILFFTILDIESKVGKLVKQQENLTKKLDSSLLEEYKGKDVCLNVNNEDIDNSYLFEDISKTVGRIIDFDETWLVFEYIYKNEKTYQYFRIQDITSINEIEKK